MKFDWRTTKRKNITLVNVSDIHLGHVNCDKQVLDNVVDFIKKNDCVWIGGGDYGDCIIPNDSRFDYNSIDMEYKTPQEQYAYIEQLFKPISKKCLGLLDGNHDYTHMQRHAHNYVKELCERIGTTYLTMDAYLRIHMDGFEKDLNIYTHHGWTGARTAGSRVTRLYDLYNVYPMLDLYIMGHVHALSMVEPKTSLYIGNDGEIHDLISRFIYGGSFLKGYVLNNISYIEMKTYPPSTLGSPCLKITPFEGKHGVNFSMEYREIR